MSGITNWIEKTDAGRHEVASRSGGLDRRLRALLIMVDGKTGEEALQGHAMEFGLGADAVQGLLMSGLVRRVFPEAQASNVEQAPVEAAPRMAKRSLAAARLYLMDIVVRTFGTPDHPIRAQLIAATDIDAVERAFDSLLEVLRTSATPALVAHIESTFRGQLPVRQ